MKRRTLEYFEQELKDLQWIVNNGQYQQNRLTKIVNRIAFLKNKVETEKKKNEN